MLGKLLKYEFKATGRVFLPMFGALLIISVINRLFSNLNFKIPSIIGKIISIILIVGIFADSDYNNPEIFKESPGQ